MQRWQGFWTSLDSSLGDGKTGPVSCHCELEDGRMIRRHIDYVRLRQHTSDRVIRKDHTNIPKNDSIKGERTRNSRKGRG